MKFNKVTGFYSTTQGSKSISNRNLKHESQIDVIVGANPSSRVRKYTRSEEDFAHIYGYC
ncbi:hypothetical protein [Candidatus Nitrosocosmicus franklandus]|uniref:Uncharacterized protein n=1 Tax=Candidatus Nitrosocosmicus franklandianus TaxID=1798806 RepID=A0A484IGP9_9ARCH|nr:hypothetical protein [Candidatus Nitrosocosmicus franklandus]VFJ15380.1 protein of unknown function [Candidatus Nitrosocosmicus franklandus]